MRYGRRYPPTVSSPAETEIAAATAAAVVGGDDVRHDSPPSMGSEDFAWFLERKPDDRDAQPARPEGRKNFQKPKNNSRRDECAGIRGHTPIANDDLNDPPLPSAASLPRLAAPLRRSGYGEYLLKVLAETVTA